MSDEKILTSKNLEESFGSAKKTSVVIKISLIVSMGTILFLAGLLWSTAVWKTQMEYKINLIEEKVFVLNNKTEATEKALSTKIDIKSSDKWNKTQMAGWVDRARKANPDVDFPSVWEKETD